MNIAVGSDHAGYPLKEGVIQHVKALGHSPTDVGAYGFDPDDDYPDFAIAIAKVIIKGEAERGILMCGSGVGAVVALNKMRGIRACVCHDLYSAQQGVEHDDINVLCLGGRIVGPNLATELVTAFLNAKFSGEERHVRRLGKVKDLDNRLGSIHTQLP